MTAETVFRGDRVRVTEGPFRGCAGSVDYMSAFGRSIRVLLFVLGRLLSVELRIEQVERA